MYLSSNRLHNIDISDILFVTVFEPVIYTNAYLYFFTAAQIALCLAHSNIIGRAT